MPTLRWRKSTYSPDGSNCVEIGHHPTSIHIRDSKSPTAPHPHSRHRHLDGVSPVRVGGPAPHSLTALPYGPCPR
ncbi:DUF397 domain-containing protein [Streptomyces tricolor]|nr:DUF397 domain-containing protein [Streptomyces tricolor]